MLNRKNSIEEEKEEKKMKTIEKAKQAKRSESVLMTQDEMDASLFGLNNGNSKQQDDSLFSK